MFEDRSGKGAFEEAEHQLQGKMYKPFNVDITNVASDSKQFSVRISELKMVIIVQIWRLLVVCQSKQGDRLRKAEEVTRWPPAP